MLVVAASVGVHGLILASIGSQVPRSVWRIRNLEQSAVRIELSRPPPPPEQRPAPPTPAKQKRRERSSQPAATPGPVQARPHLTSAPPPAGAPSPWTVGPPPALPPGFLGSLQAHVGCADADLAHMAKAQREACARRLADGAASAPFIQAPMAPEKRAAFDRAVRCRKEYDDAPVPVGTQGWGLGYIPRLRDCGPKDH